MGHVGRGRRRAVRASAAPSRTPTPPRATARRPRAHARGLVHATRSCRSTIPQKKGAAVVVDRDEAIRADTTAEALAALKPAFKKDGTVTAGNAPGVNDGAAALVVMAADKARGARPHAARAHRRPGDERPGAEAGADDAGRSGAEGRREGRLERSTDVDLFELNEAFSVQAVAVMRELGIDPARVNVHGGAVALGHRDRRQRRARADDAALRAEARGTPKRGIATLCLGGGNGVALAVERVR